MHINIHDIVSRDQWTGLGLLDQKYFLNIFLKNWVIKLLRDKVKHFGIAWSHLVL